MEILACAWVYDGDQQPVLQVQLRLPPEEVRALTATLGDNTAAPRKERDLKLATPLLERALATPGAPEQP